MGIEGAWDTNAMDVEIQRAGRFILATNVLDEQVLSDEDVLTEYKAQQSTERGFRFLKDPLLKFDRMDRDGAMVRNGKY
jgi:transposase